MGTATIPFHKTAYGLPAGTKTDGKRQRCVLLIEDNKEAMRWVKHALKKYAGQEYTLEWMQCLSDGLRRLENGGIDLILLDLGLPDCSSPFSHAWVREAAPKVPIVVLTGDPSEETEVSIFTRGMEKYLVKGQVSGQTLVNAISKAMDQGQPRRELPAGNSTLERGSGNA